MKDYYDRLEKLVIEYKHKISCELLRNSNDMVVGESRVATQ